MRGLACAPASPTLNDFAARSLRKSDAGTYFNALAHIHRVIIREQSRPVLRSYRTHGFDVEHDIRNTAEWSMYIKGDHDRGVQYWINHYLGKGDTAIDIGANVGIFTLQMAELVGPSGRVMAFEPNPHSISVLERNLSINRQTENTEIHGIALGEEDCEMTLSVTGSNQGAATLLRPDAAPEQEVEVPVRNFSRWSTQNGALSAKVVKLDVEGFELSVLKGMTQYLEREDPVLLIEVTPRGRIAETLEALRLLRQLGFGLREITADPPYALPLPESLPKQMDILCARGIN